MVLAATEYIYFGINWGKKYFKLVNMSHGLDTNFTMGG